MQVENYDIHWGPCTQRAAARYDDLEEVLCKLALISIMFPDDRFQRHRNASRFQFFGRSVYGLKDPTLIIIGLPVKGRKESFLISFLL